MKKILYFLTALCAIVGLTFCVVPTKSVFCEDAPQALAQSNFVAEMTKAEKTSKSYILNENINLTLWEPVDLSGITFDGNGFTITTVAPLFDEVSNGSVIKNLGVIASVNFEYNAPMHVSNFGLVACSVKGATVTNVYAESSSIAPGTSDAEIQNNVYGQLDIHLSSSAKVGGLFGVLEEGATVKDCYTKTKLVVVQNDANALTTVIGGFVGEIGTGVTVKNCYAVQKDIKLIEASFKSGLVCTSSEIIVGGFAGKVGSNVTKLSNIFVGGGLPENMVEEGKKIVVGKIFGNLSSVTDVQIGNIYTYNLNAGLSIVGSGDITYLNIGYLSESSLTLINNFAPNVKLDGVSIWDDLYGWDINTVWCKKTVSDFPVLQVFQSFTVSINSDKNGLGLDLQILNSNKDVITTTETNSGGQDVEIPATRVDFKYNSLIYFKLTITEDFLPYKAVKNLMFNNTDEVQSFGLADNEKEVLVPVIITGATSGVYFGNTQDIKYNLKVISENDNQGNVRVKGATASIDPSKPFDLTYLKTHSYVAVSANNSYTFEKWVWLDEDGQDGPDVFIGDPDNQRNANQGVSIKFGDSVFNSEEYTYVYMTSTSVANIPSQVIDGVITFTLKAKFTNHNENLSIVLTSSSSSADIYISEIYVEGNPELSGVTYITPVTIGIPVQIRIEVAEGYTFKGWRVSDQSLSSLIDVQAGETELSTIIHVTLTDETTIYADVIKDDVQEMDLTWLWYTLGGIGGVGIIAVITFFIIRHRRQESFMDFY